jgi:hypothetical protein
MNQLACSKITIPNSWENARPAPGRNLFQRRCSRLVSLLSRDRFFPPAGRATFPFLHTPALNIYFLNLAETNASVLIVDFRHRKKIYRSQMNFVLRICAQGGDACLKRWRFYDIQTTGKKCV